ncbi:MAG: hypothetical protein AB8I08_10615 [Sandaracinaceae bacterium]
MRRPSPLSFRAFACAACLLPPCGWWIHHGFGHEGDLAFFHGWARAFSEGPAFYRDGPGVNYPILGALLVCLPTTGWVSVVGGELDFPTFHAVHKGVLVLGEIALVFASARLAKTLGAPRPRWLALGLCLLPSSWAGGAWFGQTDVYGTLALVAAADGLLRYRRNGHGRSLARGVLWLHAALLLKQLTWFAIPSLLILLLLGLRAARSGARRRTHVGWVLASPLLWLVADPWLSLPDGHISHLVYVVVRSAGDHGSLLVANGASVWVLLRSSGLAASDPWLGPVSPSQLGWAVWLFGAGMWVAKAIGRADDGALVRGAGVTSLVMALFLTGVHERYLAHAVPLLFLATAGRLRWAIGVLGVVSGLFVMSSVHSELAWAGRPEPVLFGALGCLGLLAVSGWEKMSEVTHAPEIQILAPKPAKAWRSLDI